MAGILNVAVIGAGLWGGQQARVFDSLSSTRLIGICDQDATRAAALAAEHQVPFTCQDHRELLDLPELQAIGIATPDFQHTALILDALAAGLHVLTEKPLAMTVEDAQKVHDAANASKGKLMVDFHNRVNPVITNAREKIQDGTLGRVIHASARLSNTLSVPCQMLSWADQSSALWFLGSHAVDALRFVLQDEVVRVFAVKRTGLLSSKGIDTDDVHISLLEFGNGTIVSLENSWILSDGNPQIFDFRIELVGETGQISLNPSHNAAFQLMDDTRTRYTDLLGITPSGPGRVGGFVHESIARFADSVLNDTPVLASARDGLRATQVLAAIEQSARSQQSVDINYSQDHDFSNNQ